MSVSSSIDLRTCGLGFASWIGAAAVIGIGSIGWLILTALIAVLMLFGLLTKRWLLIAVALVGAVSMSLAGVRMNAANHNLLAQAGENHAWLSVEAKVTADPLIWEGNFSEQVVAAIQVRQITYRGRSYQIVKPAKAVVSGQEAIKLQKIKVGSKISFEAIASPTDKRQRESAYLRISSSIAIIEKPNSIYRSVNSIRDGLQGAMRWASDEQAGLVPSLVVGDTSRVLNETKEDFQATGLTHLTAVSGTNLTLLLAFILPLAKRLGVRGSWLQVISVISVVSFVFLCRTEPSVLRAGAMGVVAMSAVGAGADTSKGIRNLGTAVLALTLIDPWLALSWGFILSVSASAGILWWGASWQKTMRTWASAWLAEAIAIPLSAQLATQPVVTYLSGQISVVAILANAASGPFIGPVTVLGLVAALSSQIFMPASYLLGWLAGWCIQPVIYVAHLLSKAPAATWQWPTHLLSLSILALLCLLIGWLMKFLLSKPASFVVIAIILVVASFIRPGQQSFPDDWKFVACDVGQGSAALARSTQSSAVLIDTGPDPDALLQCLRQASVNQIDAIFITHYHQDHIGGLETITQLFPEAAVIDTSSTSPGDQIVINEMSWLTISAGNVIAIPESGEAESSAENNNGLVGKIDVSGMTMLVTGDIELEAQRDILDSGYDLSSEILLVPHHGSSRQEPQLFEQVDASLAIYSAGKNNSYGHPAKKALELATANDMSIARTDLNGSVAVSGEPDKIEITVANP